MLDVPRRKGEGKRGGPESFIYLRAKKRGKIPPSLRIIGKSRSSPDIDYLLTEGGGGGWNYSPDLPSLLAREKKGGGGSPFLRAQEVLRRGKVMMDVYTSRPTPFLEERKGKKKR